VAPPEVRELRGIGRYRAKLTALRRSAKAQIQAVMARQGILPELGRLVGPAGQVLLDKMPFDGVNALQVESLRGKTPSPQGLILLTGTRNSSLARRRCGEASQNCDSSQPRRLNSGKTQHETQQSGVGASRTVARHSGGGL
jgi:hypothetical protein